MTKLNSITNKQDSFGTDLPDTDLDETMPDDDDNKENDVTKEEQDDSRDDTTDVKKIPPEDIKKNKTGQDETKKSVKRKAPLKEKENKKARVGTNIADTNLKNINL